MAFYDKFPYTNFQELNLDKIMQSIGDIDRAEEASAASAAAAAVSEANAAASENSAAASAASALNSKNLAAETADAIRSSMEQIEANSERIDQMIVDGTPTEGNSELLDIRVGANGVTYATAGTAVRAQIKNMADYDLNTTSIQSLNSYLTNDGWINGTGGIETGGSGYWKYSDKVALPSIVRKQQCKLYIKTTGSGLGSSYPVNTVTYYCNNTKIKYTRNPLPAGPQGAQFVLVDDIPTIATHVVICAGDMIDYKGNTVFSIFNPKEGTLPDLLNTFNEKLVKECAGDLRAEPGYINTSGELIDAPGWWMFSNQIDIREFNRINYKIPTGAGAALFVLYNSQGEKAKVVNNSIASGYAYVSGLLDVSPYSYMRYCLHINQTNDPEDVYQEVFVTAYNASVTGENDTVYHCFDKTVFRNKTALFTGDSITAGFTSGSTTTTETYPKLFSQAADLTYTNSAVGGASITNVSGYPQILTQLTNADLNDYDIVFVSGGINDWQLGVTPENYAAAVKQTCQYLQNNFNGTVFWILPINEAGKDPHSTPAAPLNTFRKIAAEICITYGYNVINGGLFDFPTAGSPVESVNAMFGDRLHPSEQGYRHYARMLSQILL